MPDLKCGTTFTGLYRSDGKCIGYDKCSYFKQFKIIRLRTTKGYVVEVANYSCYEPNEKGEIMFAMGGFSYGWGVPTTDKITHNIVSDQNESLVTRGRYETIYKQGENNNLSVKIKL